MIIGLIMAAFTLAMDVEPWRAINDGVMGGLSSGRMVAFEHGLRFEGELSLENSGGFASVRRLVGRDLSQTGSVRLTLRGDGRRYQFRLRQDGGFDGVAWRAEFTTRGDWQTIDLAYADFLPVYRGRPVAGAGPVVPGRIRQIGFMLADRKPGAFALEIRSVRFVELKDPGPNG